MIILLGLLLILFLRSMSPPVPTYLDPGWISLIFSWGVLMCQNRLANILWCVFFYRCCGLGLRKLQGSTDHVWWAPCQRDWSKGSQCEDNQVKLYFADKSLNSLTVLVWTFWFSHSPIYMLSLLVYILGWSTLTSTAMCRASSLSVPLPGGWPKYF